MLMNRRDFSALALLALTSTRTHAAPEKLQLHIAALVLPRIDRGHESLDRHIVFARTDLVPHSPVTEKHVGAHGMPVGELCAATITTSDNTAANLILASYGGPCALTAFARELGDTVTRVGRIEPALNGWRGVDDNDLAARDAARDAARGAGRCAHVWRRSGGCCRRSSRAVSRGLTGPTP